MLIKHCIKIFMDNKKLINVSPLTLKKYGFYFKDLQEYCFEREVVSIDGLTAPFMEATEKQSVFNTIYLHNYKTTEISDLISIFSVVFIFSLIST